MLLYFVCNIRAEGGLPTMGYTILVVEDTADTRELMKLLLEFEGYSVLEAENGVGAVQLAKREHPDAIVNSPKISRIQIPDVIEVCVKN
jgi:CheY-like chemotaxis protein